METNNRYRSSGFLFIVVPRRRNRSLSTGPARSTHKYLYSHRLSTVSLLPTSVCGGVTGPFVGSLSVRRGPLHPPESVGLEPHPPTNMVHDTFRELYIVELVKLLGYYITIGI